MRNIGLFRASLLDSKSNFMMARHKDFDDSYSCTHFPWADEEFSWMREWAFSGVPLDFQQQCVM